LLETANPIIEERVLSIDDLSSGQVWFGNALRGLIRARNASANGEAVVAAEPASDDAALEG